MLPRGFASTGFLLATIFLGSGTWLAIDLDSDGLSAFDESRLGLDPTHGDTDGDGLEDGWETRRGLGPHDPDQDRDGVSDGDDVRMGGSPFSSDTDLDGVADSDEPLTDCNANGINAIGDADDDSDARSDGTESADARCDPDVDDDGILDGFERAELCVRQTDCDDDGLLDRLEYGTSFDPLNPDTFETRLADAVLWAFRERGQEPSGDLDQDGIPDGWEGTTGLIEWGAFRPAPGRPDLLIEIIRVSGPDSSRFDDVSFESMYASLANVFRTEGDITLSWVETRIRVGTEPRPPSIPSRLSEYYRDLLANTTYATNPYVTTIVLNPQHDQSEVLHLGVAPIRGMLAAVDYGAHTTYSFRGTRVEQQGNQVVQTNVTLTMSPFVESVIAADRQDAIRALGFESGTRLDDGRYRLVAAGYRLEWEPSWFRTAPLVTWDDGRTAQLSVASRQIQGNVFGSTTLHEIGHTLGLCHLELPECYATLLPEERLRIQDSTMGPGHDSESMHFFATEWERAKAYLACPPDRPLVLIAQSANDTDVLDQKYGYELEEILSVDLRRCGQFPKVPGERFQPVTDPLLYVAAEEDRDPEIPATSRFATLLYASSVLLFAVAAAFIPHLRAR